MKPMNFPARKLARQLRAQKPEQKTEWDWQALIESARAVRTKIKRG